jgi:multidrug resistance efflux pump
MRRSWLLVILPIASVGMFGAAAVHVAREQQPLPHLEPPVTPARSTFESAVAATGVVESETENIAVGSALEGVVMEVHVPPDKVGQLVKAGDPLFRVDDRQWRALLAVAETRVVASEARLARLEDQPRLEELPPAEAKVRGTAAAAALALDEFQRAEGLQRRGAVTEQEVITKRLSYEAARQEQARAQAEYELLAAGAWEPDVAIARAAVAEAHAEADRIRTEIDRATVRAPVDGRVLQVNVRAGEYVSARAGTPLMVLGNVAVLHVRVDVDEHDIPRLQTPSGATAYVRGDADHPVSLRFRRIEPLVVAKRSLSGDNTERIDTRVLPVIYEVATADARLYIGQQVDVFIERH